MADVFAKSSLKSGASLVALGLMLGSSAAFAGGLPHGGHYVAGRGTLNKATQSLTVKQSSIAGIIDWKGFSVGKHGSVTFDNGSGATLNRVTGGNLSRIAGTLHATGSLYLINSSGVIVSGTGRVVTGGSFIASSSTLSNSAFDSHERRFGDADAKVINRGSITSGDEAKLVGSSVANTGTITGAHVKLRATEGDAVAAGTIRAIGNAHHDAHILVISDTGTTHIAGALIAHNRDGSGGNIETSGRKLSIGGRIDAGKGGSWLVDPENLTVGAKAAKTINAALGDGSNVTLRTTANGTTGSGQSSKGVGDLEIKAALSWDTSATLTLDAYHSVHFNDPTKITGHGKLAVVTDDGGTGGHLRFLDGGSVTFCHLTDHLTVNGHRYTLVDNIAQLAQDIMADPSGRYALAANYDASADGSYKSSPISTTFTGTFEGLGHSIAHLTIAQSAGDESGLFAKIGAAGSVNYFSLTDADITTNAGATAGAIAGVMNGVALGDTASGTLSGAIDAGGLFGDTGAQASITNSVSRVEISATPNGAAVGGLVGTNAGAVTGSSSSGQITCERGNCGGLVGVNSGAISSSKSSSKVSNKSSVAGGLVGSNSGMISASSTSGIVDASGLETGGLVGINTGDIEASFSTSRFIGIVGGGLVGVNANDGTINASYSSGIGSSSETVFGGLVAENDGTVSNSHSSRSNYTSGGLVSDNYGTITNSYATGDSKLNHTGSIGGLVGDNYSAGSIDHSYATGNISIKGYSEGVGGLVGLDLGIIENSHASGNVTGEYSDFIGGGLVGIEEGYSTVIENSYAAGDVTGGKHSMVGGLIGEDGERHQAGASTSEDYATGNVTAGELSSAGGLVGKLGDGEESVSFSQSSATGNVSAGRKSNVGGLIGYIHSASISQSYATGTETGGEKSRVGGLVGEVFKTTISQSYATGASSGSANAKVGGLVGYMSDNDHHQSSSISDSYATGSVKGGENTYDGSVVGRAVFSKSGDLSISTSYGTGSVSAGAGSYAGGFMGYLNGPAELSSDYWDTTTTGISADFGVGNINNETGITGLSNKKLKSGLPAGFDNSIWGQKASINGCLPYLIALESSY